jgi:hypothetical protein
MAYKKQVDDIKKQIKRFRRLTHYAARIVPLVVIVGAVAWFFVLRSPGTQDKTSGTAGAAPKTTTSTTSQNAKPEPKVGDNPTTTASTDATKEGDSNSENGKLPETGPADTLAIFAVAATAGTLFWEWHLRRIRQNS